MGHRKKNAGKEFLTVKIPDWLPPVEVIISSTGLKPDRMRIIAHQFFLCWLWATKSPNRKKTHLYANGYFPVNSSILRQVGTDRYFEYVELLMCLGVIERKANQEGGSNYSPGFHSQMYRFLLPEGITKLKFRDERVTDYRTIKSVLLKRDRYALDDKEETGNTILLPVNHALKQFVLDTTFDMEIAVAIEQKSNPAFAVDAYAELDMLHLATICNGDTGWHVIDKFGERYHHHILNINKRFRPALRFKGYENENLVSIDIACSQPYFSSELPWLLHKLLVEFEPLRELVDELSRQPDFRHYRSLCETGKFNSFLALMRGIDETAAKTEFFKAVIYAKRRISPCDVAMRNEFRRFFPGVYKFFGAVKRLDEKDLPALKDIIVASKGKYGTGNNAHKILPCLLQRAESRLMYQHIAPRMLTEGLTPFLTIHDALLVLPGHVEPSITVINSAFKELGVTPPTLRVKNLAEE